MPFEFQKAYEEGTRSFDGSPGYDYWQNSADYNIDVTIVPSTRIAAGKESVTYYNNSPDVLDRIVLRLYQNINRPGNQRDFTFNEKYLTKGIEIKSISIDNVDYKVKDSLLEYTGTNLVIKGLNILPGKKTQIKVSWEFEVPAGNFIRMGAYDSTVFFMAYWYPQVAVYDDIYKWDLIEYTGGTEFYNDFNNYNVSITVPNNFGIWATGELTNAGKVLSPDVYSRYLLARKSEKIINIISNPDYTDKHLIFKNDNPANTWKFKAEGVPDFTFGLSDHFLWDANIVFDGTKNVFVSAVYDPTSAQFYDVCDVTSRTVEMMSHKLPGTPFPFPKITVFNGGGGMESPMMVNMGANGERIWMVHTTVHEAAHSYFPFYMGINERRYAWMDEGWTQMLSEYIQYAIDTAIDFRQRNVKRYMDLAGSFDEVPMMYPSYMIKRNAYGNASYFRPAAAYNILKDVLDKKQPGLFKLALAEYINRWNGKHPTPYDFFFTFEDVYYDNLDWFWEPWFFEHGYPDLNIDSVISEGSYYKVLVDNSGTMPVPIVISLWINNDKQGVYEYSADVWKDGKDELWFDCYSEISGINKITLGNNYIPDADSTNNVWNKK